MAQHTTRLASDRELRGEYIRIISSIFEKKMFVDECCRKANFIVRFLRIHPVQNVINNMAQLSGRGFSRIFHMRLVLSQHHVFVWYSKMNAGPCNLETTNKKKTTKQTEIVNI